MVSKIFIKCEVYENDKFTEVSMIQAKKLLESGYYTEAITFGLEHTRPNETFTFVLVPCKDDDNNDDWRY